MRFVLKKLIRKSSCRYLGMTQLKYGERMLILHLDNYENLFHRIHWKNKYLIVILLSLMVHPVWFSVFWVQWCFSLDECKLYLKVKYGILLEICLSPVNVFLIKLWHFVVLQLAFSQGHSLIWWWWIIPISGNKIILV